MPFEWVGFRINPPIREAIGNTPDGIKLISENGVIIELQVKIGEERTEKIKNSENFKKIFAESEDKWIADNPGKARNTNERSVNYINLLKQDIRDYATQKANNFINQLNFMLNSATYAVQFKELAILQFERELQYGASGYVKGDYVTDIVEIDDEDNVLNRIINNYTNGLKALKNGDLVSAYYYFYLAIPEKQDITTDPALKLNLKILRDGASHNVLNSQALQKRAKELLGEDFVKPEKGNASKTYAYIDKTNPRHMDLFKKHIPIVKESARTHITDYIQSQK